MALFQTKTKEPTPRDALQAHLAKIAALHSKQHDAQDNAAKAQQMLTECADHDAAVEQARDRLVAALASGTDAEPARKAIATLKAQSDDFAEKKIVAGGLLSRAQAAINSYQAELNPLLQALPVLQWAVLNEELLNLAPSFVAAEKALRDVHRKAFTLLGALNSLAVPARIDQIETWRGVGVRDLLVTRPGLTSFGPRLTDHDELWAAAQALDKAAAQLIADLRNG